MKTLHVDRKPGVLEVRLDRAPLNEIGSDTLLDLEALLQEVRRDPPRALLLHSARPEGFCAGADLRELYRRSKDLDPARAVQEVRDFLTRIHAVFDALDRAPFPTFAAVSGVVFGGGFELALTCDGIVADKTARFCFPELRLGLVPGFGGIPRLRRDAGNALVRDLLFTGRSLNAQRAHQAGLVSQVVGAGSALQAARAAAAQAAKFDAETIRRAKRFLKPDLKQELAREIDLFCELFPRPPVQEALRRFCESKEIHPYLP